MIPSSPLTRLTDLQQRILRLIDQARAMADRPVAEAQPALGRARWEMIRLLREYQLFKHHAIFDPAIERGTPAQAALARDLKERCLAAGEAFRLHAMRWSGIDLTARWTDYRRAMDAITGQIVDHLDREARDVPRLIGAAPPPAPAPARRSAADRRGSIG